jgi:hypothetical protein
MIKILLILSILTNIVFAKNITVTGYGNSKDEALKSAFQNAVEQEVGVLVDSKTVIRNNKLIKNKILTYSNGFIKDYKELSANQQMGFWTVKISAIVEHQKLLSKIKKIKIKPKNISGTKQLYAQVVSQVKTKFDAEELFKKFYRTFTSVPIENYSANIQEFYIDTDLATRKTVQIRIKAKINYKFSPIVKQQLESAYDLMKKLSIGSYTSNDLSLTGFFTGKNPSYPNEIIVYAKGKKTYFGFPRSYSVIYPFNRKNGFGKPKRKRIGYLKIELLDKNGRIFKELKTIEFHVRGSYDNTYEKILLKSMVSGLVIAPTAIEIEKETYASGYIVDEYEIYWKMPIKYLKKIKQIKAEIKWL